MTVGVLLLVLVALQAKHLLADYVLQNTYMVRNKGHYGHPGGLLHAGVHAGFSAAVLAAAGVSWAVVIGIAFGEWLLHYHIDWAKERAGQRLRMTLAMARFWAMHGFDQFLHHVTYVGIIWLLARWVSW